jgi:hypothetical protein
MVTFAVTLPPCIHVPDNTRLISTYSEKYSVADVFCEICIEILKGRDLLPVSANSAPTAQTLISLLLLETSENWGGEKKVKRPTYPFFWAILP